MSSTRALVLWLILGRGVCAPAVAQNPPRAQRVPYDGSDSLSGPKPIHIDERGRILPGGEGVPLKKKTHPYRDSSICSLEGPKESTHWEERITGNTLQRWLVRVTERTLVFRNIADEPVMYVVQYNVPQNWFIDSDPKPWQTVGQMAYFRVYVKPGETIRLHVGIRREWLQKSKPL
jgi:hypothetical protein